MKTVPAINRRIGLVPTAASDRSSRSLETTDSLNQDHRAHVESQTGKKCISQYQRTTNIQTSGNSDGQNRTRGNRIGCKWSTGPTLFPASPERYTASSLTAWSGVAALGPISPITNCMHARHQEAGSVRCELSNGVRGTAGGQARTWWEPMAM